MSDEITTRYVAGMGFKEDEAYYSVWQLLEQAGTNSVRPVRVTNPIPIIEEMTKGQAEHLHMQIGKAIGKDYDGLVARVLAELERAPDYTIVKDNPAGRALWKANRADAAVRILRGLPE